MDSFAKLIRLVAGGFFVPACLILVLQAASSRMLTVEELKIPIPGLHELPLEFAKWRAAGEQTLDSNVVEYLKPDEYILRDYVGTTIGEPINLFVAYFKSLQNAYGPHSPRVCLPGSGWLIRSSSFATLNVAGRVEGIPINDYVLEKSGQQILVLYWYQNDRDVWAEEFRAKLKLLPELIKYHRFDVSLIRVIAPIQTPEVLGKRREQALAFSASIFPHLVERLGRSR